MTLIKGIQSGDRFVILCEKCDKEIHAEYLGFDPVVPHFNVTCENCGDLVPLKLSSTHWKGLAPQAYDM